MGLHWGHYGGKECRLAHLGCHSVTRTIPKCMTCVPHLTFFVRSRNYFSQCPVFGSDFGVPIVPPTVSLVLAMSYWKDIAKVMLGFFLGIGFGVAPFPKNGQTLSGFSFTKKEGWGDGHEGQLKPRDAEGKTESTQSFPFSISADGAIRTGPFGVHAWIQVASLTKGALVVPPEVNELWIDVGTNSFGDSIYGDHKGKIPQNVFVLAFEPLLDKYAAMLAKNSPRLSWDSRFVSPGQYHRQGIIFPFAIGKDGLANFTVSTMDGCSTLGDFNGVHHFADDNSRKRQIGCSASSQTRSVPSVKLEAIIDLLPRDRDWQYQYMKVDAQGFDLQVAESAGKYLKKFQSVLLESYPDGCHQIYTQAFTCRQIYDRMVSHGFYVKDKSYPAACYKENRKGSCETINTVYSKG